METIISIICPIYNSQDYLKETINSVINQTDGNWELILVDDGSSDGSGLLCDGFSLKDKRIKTIHKKNEGQMKARLDGAYNSSGSFIVFLDSDDLLETNTIETLRKIIISNVSIEVFLFNASTFPKKDNNKILPAVNNNHLYKNNDELINYTFGEQMFGYLWMYCIKKDILLNISKDDVLSEIRYTEDGLFMYRVLSSVNNLYVFNDCLYKYRDNTMSITHNLNEKDRRDRFLVFNYIYKSIYESKKTFIINNRLAESISWSIFSYLEHIVDKRIFKEAFHECRDSFLFKKICKQVNTNNRLFKVYKLLLIMKKPFIFYKIAHR